MSTESVVSPRSPLRSVIYFGTAAFGAALGAEQFAEGQGWIDNLVPNTLGDIPTAPMLYGVSALSVVGGSGCFLV